MTNLNPSQQAAVDSNALTIVCTASPGSGKSRVLVARIMRLICDGVNPQSMVAISFSNSAANVLKERLGGIQLGFNGTLHSWLLSLLREHGAAIGLPPKLAVIDEQTGQEILEDVKHEMGWRGTKKALDAALADVPFLLAGQRLNPAQLVSAAYHRQLIINGLLDYNSILSYGLHLIREWKASWPWDYLFIDEVQDSGEMDWAVYDSDKFHNVFLCGDINQSIYGFRRAAPENLEAAVIASRLDANPPCGSDFRLAQNYRSAKSIVQAANRLIDYNDSPIESEMEAVRDEEGAIVAVGFDDERDQKESFTRRIGLAVDEGGASIAILCRTNWQVDDWAMFLKGQGISVQQRKLEDVPMDWHKVRAAVAFFCNPENDILAYQVLRLTRGDKAAQDMRRAAIQNMRTINSDYELIKETPPVEAIPEALARMNVSQESLARVAAAIATLPQGSDRTVMALSLALAPISETVSHLGDAKGVCVSTIHGAKGMEFDAVFLPSWNQELFPGRKTGEALAEERRLAYVAVTRAKDEVWVGTTKAHRGYGAALKPEPMTPSQFIKEMQLEIL